MKKFSTYNTYISIDLCVWKPETGIKNSGRIYTSVGNAKLDLHLPVDYCTAKKEMAKLMLRTGKMPDVIGTRDEEMVMYSLRAFLD